MRRVSLFKKVFAYTVLLMLLIIMIAFLLLHFMVPPLYRSTKEQEMSERIDNLLSDIEGQEREWITESVQDFITENHIYGTLTDSNGQVLFQSTYGFSISMGDTSLSANGEEAIIETFYETVDYMCDITGADNEMYSLGLTMSLQPVNEASRVILSAIPIVVGICLVVSVLLAVLFSSHITVPIRGISEATTKMMSLDKEAHCAVKSRDEIGVLASNVNHLYVSLLDSIENLKKEISEREDTEKNKLDFLRALSHELKTPLTAIRGMLEGMMHDVGVYKDHKTYLAECNRQIETMAALIQSVLDTSRLEIAGEKVVTEITELVSELMPPFEIIAKANGVDIQTNYRTQISIRAEKAVLSKAISNIVSNAVNYTPRGGSVKISTTGNALNIENDCVPLSSDELKSIFELFYRPDFSRKLQDGRNGLGLYIVNRILKTCEYQYEFKPLSDNSGMVFTVWFADPL